MLDARDGRREAWFPKLTSVSAIAVSDGFLVVDHPGDRIAACSPSRVTSLDVSPGGAMLASGHAGKEVLVRDVASGKVRAALSHEASIASVRWSPDGKSLATTTMEKGTGSRTVLDLATKRRWLIASPLSGASSVR